MGLSLKYPAPSISYQNANERTINNVNYQFLISLIHEARNPLATIKLATELRQNIVVMREQTEFLEIVRNRCNRINEILTNSLLSLQSSLKVFKEFCHFHKLK